MSVKSLHCNFPPFESNENSMQSLSRALPCDPAIPCAYTGADIANVANEAALKAARDGAKQVTGAELEYAIERVVGGTEKRSQVRGQQTSRDLFIEFRTRITISLFHSWCFVHAVD